MMFGRIKRTEKKPAAKLDFSDIRDTYRWSDESEREPGQELALHRGLGLTALRNAKFNFNHLYFTNLLDEKKDADKSGFAA